MKQDVAHRQQQLFPSPVTHSPKKNRRPGAGRRSGSGGTVKAAFQFLPVDLGTHAKAGDVGTAVYVKAADGALDLDGVTGT